MTKPSAKELVAAARVASGDSLPGRKLAARVEKALELHVPGPYYQPDERLDAPKRCCRYCKETWPCPTVRLLDGEDV